MFNQLVTRHCCPEVQRSFNYMVQGWLPLKGSRQVEKGVQNGVKTDTKSEIFQAAARGVRRGVFIQNRPDYELQNDHFSCLTRVFDIFCLLAAKVDQFGVRSDPWEVQKCPGRAKVASLGSEVTLGGPQLPWEVQKLPVWGQK